LKFERGEERGNGFKYCLLEKRMTTMIPQLESLPDMVRQMFDPLDEAVRAALDEKLCRSLQRVFITGAGDSHFAALTSELAFEELGGIAAEPMTALRYGRYTAGYMPQTGPNTNLVVGISVSGAVARTAEALTMAQQFGATTLALTATPGSRVADAAGRLLLVETPHFEESPDAVTPGIRSYFANQLALMLMAVRIGEVRGHLNAQDAQSMRAELRDSAPAAERTLLANMSAARSLAYDWDHANAFVFVGGGPNYGTALFAAAKLLEASGDLGIGQDTEEWTHLEYFARTPDTPTILINAGGHDMSRAIEVAEAAKAIGRRVAVISPQEHTALSGAAPRFMPVVMMREMFSPLVLSIPATLFAACRAEASGESYFRAFGGGRNIEEGGGASRIRTSETWDRWPE
jgi:glutamine---fructose-6-phosphate transaminase (isomerizing)